MCDLQLGAAEICFLHTRHLQNVERCVLLRKSSKATQCSGCVFQRKSTKVVQRTLFGYCAISMYKGLDSNPGSGGTWGRLQRIQALNPPPPPTPPACSHEPACGFSSPSRLSNPHSWLPSAPTVRKLLPHTAASRCHLLTSTFPTPRSGRQNMMSLSAAISIDKRMSSHVGHHLVKCWTAGCGFRNEKL